MQNNEVLLFVTNQNTNIDKINKIIEKEDFKTVLILSTHKYFEFEKRTFCCKNRILIFHTFDDFLNDESMWACDSSAQKFESKPFNFENFMKNLMKEKNRVIKQKINNIFEIKKIYCDTQLGIVPDIWNSCTLIDSVSNKNNSSIASILGKVKNKFTKLLRKREITIVQNKSDSIMFVTHVKRLKLNPDLIIKKFEEFEAIFKIKVLCGFYKKFQMATTIHNYDRNIWSLTDKLYLFTDGYFPSNYHPAFIDTYDKSIIVSDNFIDEKWFIAQKKIIHRTNIFEDKSFSHVSLKDKSVKNVLVILGHAGDWTALISRSDNDKMLESIDHLAKLFPTIEFILRPHPTMTHPSHEGVNSLKRIEKFVSSCQLKNLKISSNTLNQDLNDCDLMITEYSNAFIDGLKIGKLGIITNLTNRRNFMHDYSDLGFITAHNFEQLQEILKQCVTHLSSLISQQNIAADLFNLKQKEFITNSNY